jgi:hypothetical protein
MFESLQCLVWKGLYLSDDKHTLFYRKMYDYMLVQCQPVASDLYIIKSFATFCKMGYKIVL